MKFTDLMLDLETLGTEADSTILSLGACLFNPEEGIYGESLFNEGLLIDFQGGSIKTDTVKWWLTQDEAARQLIADRLSKGREPYLVFHAFNDWLRDQIASAASTSALGADKQLEHIRVWGNGAGFDQPIVRRLMRDNNVPVLWKFWNERCFRTIKAFAVPRGQKLALTPSAQAIVDKLTPHDGGHDALKQAIELTALWPRVKRLAEV